MTTRGHHGILLGEGGTPPIGTPHRYWRLLINAPDGSTLYCGMTRLELRGTVGGADLTQTTGSWEDQSSEINPGNRGFYAFSTSLTNGWLSADASPAWDSWDFEASPQAIAQIAITGSYNAPDASPKDFQLQWSDDNSSWTSALTVTGQTGWTGSSDVRVFTVP